MKIMTIKLGTQENSDIELKLGSHGNNDSKVE